jgi:hypothetical protein
VSYAQSAQNSLQEGKFDTNKTYKIVEVLLIYTICYTQYTDSNFTIKPILSYYISIVSLDEYSSSETTLHMMIFKEIKATTISSEAKTHQSMISNQTEESNCLHYLAPNTVGGQLMLKEYS